MHIVQTLPALSAFVMMILLTFAASSVVDYKLNLGKIQSGSFNLKDVTLIDKKTHIRSVAECASYCYADDRCRTAVYLADSKYCYLLEDYNIDELIPSDKGGEVVRFYSDGSDPRYSPPRRHCPDCDRTSVCVQNQALGVNSEGMCSDFAESFNQYRSNESCQYVPYIQSKEYYLSNLVRNTPPEGGTLFSVVFEKLLDWTKLRVKWRGTLRVFKSQGQSSVRWTIKFDGQNCLNPSTIEGLHWDGGSNISHHKASGIHGICNALLAGSRNISLVAENGTGSLQVGYATQASRLMIDEIVQDTDNEAPVHECPTLPAFNIEQYNSDFGTPDNNNATLWSVSYNKMENATALRINVDFIIRVLGHTSQSCNMWYILIDGHSCSPTPLGRVLANLYQGNLVVNEHRSVEIEGHCTGISAGNHILSLYIDRCLSVEDLGEVPLGDAHTGLHNTQQRFIVEEIRLHTKDAAGLSSDLRTMYRYPQFNMVIHGLSPETFPEDSYGGVNEGVVWKIPDYTKYYMRSGVRLTLSSDARCMRDEKNVGFCCRHYFMINGRECETPGTIEGITRLNKEASVHRPVMIEGTCEDIPAGTVLLSVNAGVCYGETQTGACWFGWRSYVSLMVSETFVDQIEEDWSYIISPRGCRAISQSTGYLFTYRERCYQFILSEQTWNEAKSFCHQHGAKLINVETMSKQHWLQSVLSNRLWSVFDKSGFWIGLHDKIEEGTFYWDMGPDKLDVQNTGYFNWYPGEPNDLAGQDCVYIRRQYGWRWVDVGCDGGIGRRYSFACEYDMQRTNNTSSTSSNY